MARTASGTLVVVLLLASAGGLAIWSWQSSDAHAAEVDTAPPAAAPGEPPPPAPATGAFAVQTPEQAGVAPADCILYPDGTRLPPLNGVEKAPRIAFHRRIPFAPVLGKMTDANGLEWYVHENGAWSTTRYQVRDGRREAVGELRMPAESQPLLGR